MTNNSGALGELLVYVGANMEGINPHDAKRALMAVKGLAPDLASPVVAGVKVPFNKVPEVVFDPHTEELFFIGVDDGSKHPSGVYKLGVTGCALVGNRDRHISHLKIGPNGSLAFVTEAVHQKITWEDSNGQRVYYTLISEFGPKDELLFFDDGSSIVRTIGGTSQEGVEITRQLDSLSSVTCSDLNVFDDKLFFIRPEKNNDLTVVWGDQRHTLPAGKVLPDTVYLKNGVVRFVFEDGFTRRMSLHEVELGQPHVSKFVEHGHYRTAGNRLFETEHGSDVLPLNMTTVIDLESGAHVRIQGEVVEIVVTDWFVCMLSSSMLKGHISSWGFDSKGVPAVGPKIHHEETVDRSATQKMKAFRGFVAVEYKEEKTGRHYLRWFDGEKLSEPMALFAPFDRLTQVGDRLLSWHFNSGTLFITDYTPGA
jgi:hypothetical protein